MSGIIAVYSLVIAVLIAGDMGPPPAQNYSLFKYARLPRYRGCNILDHSRCEGYMVRNGYWLDCSGFMHLACGLSVGLTGLAAGYAIGIVGDMGVRSFMQQSRIFVGMVLILIFGEVLGLYGLVQCGWAKESMLTVNSLIVALILNTKSRGWWTLCDVDTATTQRQVSVRRVVERRRKYLRVQLRRALLAFRIMYKGSIHCTINETNQF